MAKARAQTSSCGSRVSCSKRRRACRIAHSDETANGDLEKTEKHHDDAAWHQVGSSANAGLYLLLAQNLLDLHCDRSYVTHKQQMARAVTPRRVTCFFANAERHRREPSSRNSNTLLVFPLQPDTSVEKGRMLRARCTEYVTAGYLTAVDLGDIIGPLRCPIRLTHLCMSRTLRGASGSVHPQQPTATTN